MSGDERGRRAAVRHLVNDIATEGIMQMLRAPPEMSNVTLFGEGAGIGGDADYGQGFEAAYERASAAPGLKAMGLTAMGGDFESAFEAASSMQQRESAIRRFAAHYTGTMIGATKNRMEEVDEVQLDEAWLMLEELASDQPLTAELKKAPKTAARADQTETTDKMMDETALNLVWELMHHEHAGIPAYMEAFDHTHDHSDARVLRLSDIADCLETAWKLHREDEATFAVKASIGPEGGLGLEINDSLTIVRVLPSARIMADAKVRARFLPLMYGDRIVAADRVGDASWLTIFRAGNSAVMPGGVPPGRSPAEAAPLVTDLLWFAPATSSQSTPDRLRQNFQSTSSFASGEQKRSIVGDSNSIDSWPIQSPQYHRSSDALPWVSPALPAAEGMRPRLRRSSFFSGEYNAVPREADSLNKDQDEASKTQFSISHLEGKELEVAAVLRFHKQLSKWKRSSSRGRSRKKRRPKSETTPSGSAEGGASRIRRGHGRSRSGGLKDELRRKKRLLGDRKRLRRVFDLIDADGGGSISKKELLSAMRSNHVARDMLSESEALRPLMKPKGMAQLWAKLDVDHDGSISLPEWEAAASSVADHEKLRRVFQSIDIDDSNTISKKEILAVVRDGEKSRALFAMSDGLRPLLRPRGHTMLFKIMDRDGDGEISFEDFAAVCGTASDRLKLYRLFKSIDVDGSGSISRRELLKSIRDEEEVREYIRESENLRPLLKPRGFAVLFKTMDDDASGEISFKELVDFADGAVELIKLRQIFSILDADKGGSISRAEILSAVKTNEKARQMIRDSDTLRMFLKPRGFARLYTAMDGDGDGEITFEEFTSGIAKAKAVHEKADAAVAAAEAAEAAEAAAAAAAEGGEAGSEGQAEGKVESKAEGKTEGKMEGKEAASLADDDAPPTSSLGALRKLFDILDVDGNGSVERLELLAVAMHPSDEVRELIGGFERLAGILRPTRYAEVLVNGDTNGDGVLSFEELRDLCTGRTPEIVVSGDAEGEGKGGEEGKGEGGGGKVGDGVGGVEGGSDGGGGGGSYGTEEAGGPDSLGGGVGDDLGALSPGRGGVLFQEHAKAQRQSEDGATPVDEGKEAKVAGGGGAVDAPTADLDHLRSILYRVFAAMDKSGNGSLNKIEILRTCHKKSEILVSLENDAEAVEQLSTNPLLQPLLRPKTWMKQFIAMDDDGSGEVDKEEFVAFLLGGVKEEKE